MSEPRKVFRIEQTAVARLEQCLDNTQSGLRHAEIMRELSALRALLAAPPSQRTRDAAAPHNTEATRLTSELNLIAGAIGGGANDGKQHAASNGRREQAAPMTRIAHELTAVVNGTEQATQKVLAAAEEIDSVANNLSAALKGKIEQGLAQDIQDLVIQIFEACNFQDLIGQRVGKVMATLQFIEEHIARVLDEIKLASSSARRNGAQSLHGPRLDGDRGHVSQGEVDAMFG